MSTNVLLSIGVALALGAGAVQLDPQDKSRLVTLTGCLRHADAAHKDAPFVLVAARLGKGTPDKSPTKGPWYSVAGDPEELRSRVGRRVEITGTLDTAGSVIGTSASATDGPSGIIHARRVKVISPTCHE